MMLMIDGRWKQGLQIKKVINFLRILVCLLLSRPFEEKKLIILRSYALDYRGKSTILEHLCTGSSFSHPAAQDRKGKLTTIGSPGNLATQQCRCVWQLTIRRWTGIHIVSFWVSLSLNSDEWANKIRQKLDRTVLEVPSAWFSVDSSSFVQQVWSCILGTPRIPFPPLGSPPGQPLSTRVKSYRLTFHLFRICVDLSTCSIWQSRY